MSTVEEKRSLAKEFETSARNLRKEAQEEDQKNCRHVWTEGRGHNMSLYRVCQCGKTEFYNHYAGVWPS